MCLSANLLRDQSTHLVTNRFQQRGFADEEVVAVLELLQLILVITVAALLVRARALGRLVVLASRLKNFEFVGRGGHRLEVVVLLQVRTLGRTGRAHWVRTLLDEAAGLGLGVVRIGVLRRGAGGRAAKHRGGAVWALRVLVLIHHHAAGTRVIGIRGIRLGLQHQMLLVVLEGQLVEFGFL